MSRLDLAAQGGGSSQVARSTSMDRTSAFIHDKLGLPGRNAYDLPDSKKRFADGAQYRLELPGIQNHHALRAGLEAAKQRGLTLHRITHTIGIMRNTDEEIREMVAISRDWGVELNMSVGPRATYDLSPQVSTPEGARIGYRLRGADQLVRAIEDVRRAVEFGVRCVMVYDEGMLWVLDEMRRAGEMPADLHIKASAHMGHGNPASMKVLERLGANSINPVRDLDLPTWSALRGATDIPLDFSSEAPKSSGGFYRDYEVPEVIRIAAPVYVKSGGAEMATHAAPPSVEAAQSYVRRMELVVGKIERYAPDARRSGHAPADLAIPAKV
ncbi:MBL fold metallo-hydrolase [Bradyrhizobium ottawaense]|uniref:hypothetical protein n=1 Tax=Bradyrhizobium ottawaense TaxID=931866 RepID=UPI003836F359